MKKIKRHPSTPINRSPSKIVREPIACSMKTNKKKKIKREPINTLILSKKNPQDDPEDFKKEMRAAKRRAKKAFIEEISAESGYIQRLTDTNLEPTVLYDYQQKFIGDRTKYRHCDKSRQVGQSYGFSCEGYAKSQ